MPLVNNYRNELIKWPPGQTTEKSQDMKGFLGVVQSVGHIFQEKRLLRIQTTISIKSFHSVQFENQICRFQLKM